MLGTAASASLGVFGGVFGASVLGSIVLADDQVVVDEIKGRSIKELMNANISIVIIPSDVRTLTLEFGSGSLTGRTFPIFADTNLDGVISEQEDSSVDITLTVDGLAQLKELAGFTSLNSSGIDRIQLNVTTQEALDSLADSADLSSVLQALRQQGLSVTTIDVQGGATLQVTDAQANALANNGLVFAGNDQVNLAVDAQNTNLDITLKELQKLGVDAVTVSGLSSGAAEHPLFISLGDGAALIPGALPKLGDANGDGVLSSAEDAALEVTLNITSQAQLQELSGSAAGLAASGIDHIQMLVANQNDLNALLSSTSLDTSVDLLQTAGLTGSIDMLISNAVHISDAQANALVDAGLHFAANDSITVDVNASATHLSTSLKELQKLGVDAVTVSGLSSGAADHPLFISLGDGAALTPGGLPKLGDANGDGVLSSAEDAALEVTLNITSQAQLQELSGSAAGLAASGIDHIQMLVANQNDLNALLSSTSLDTSVDLLQTAGLTGSIDMLISNAVHISDAQANALVDAGLHFAANDSITVDVNASATHLSTSLKELQKLGVDAVTVSGLSSGAADHPLFISLGDGAALTPGGLPKLGDANGDGVLSNAEDAALDVTLNITSQAQLQELSGSAAGLAASGIDHIQMLVANQNDLNALLSSTSLDTSVDLLQTAGLTGSIDMLISNAVHISDAQANALVDAGLHFAANDSITVDVNASATHLSTSLKELQKLGVDAVTVSGLSSGAADHPLFISLGDGAALTPGGLPKLGDANGDGVLSNAEDAALDVTLNITSQAQLQELSGSAAGLAASGIDHIQMLVANQNDLNALLSSTSLDTSVDLLQTAGLTGSIDMLTSSAVHISDAQANALVDAGLHFAANDSITVDVNASATHLSTSLKELQKLGVDAVTVSGLSSGAADHPLFISLGDGAALTPGALPKLGDANGDGVLSSAEDAALDVILRVQNLNELAALNAMQDQLAAIGIDHTELLVTQELQVLSLIENGVNLITGNPVTAQTDWQQVLGTLQDSGIASVSIQNDADVSLSDDLSAALYEAGMLHALPDANVVIDAGTNKLLQTSLKAMVEIGVDGVQADHKVYVQLGADLEEVNGLIADFVEQAPTAGLFGEGQAGVLVSQAMFSQLSNHEIATLVGQLSQLGFTEIDLLDSSQIAQRVYKIADQTYAPVEVIGAVQQDLYDVFGSDILHKKVN